MAPSTLDGALYREMLKGGASCLHQNATVVNDLNVFPIPDGDTGDNMSMTVEGGVLSSDRVDTDDLGEMARIVADGMLLSARGNSGVILSQFFGGIAEGLSGATEADARLLGEAFRAGVRKAYDAVLEPTEGTILTVAREATEYAVARINEENSLESFLLDFLDEMNRSLSRTPELLPVLKEAGVIDSGGAGLLYVMEGMSRIFRGEEMEISAVAEEKRGKPVDFSAFTEDSTLEFGYCTELLLRLQSAKVDVASFDIAVITDFLKEIGNSVVALKNGSIVKIHVHTMTPGDVFSFCQKFGEFLTVEVENMTLQHNEIEEERPEAAPLSTVKTEEKRKPYGVVTVVSGKGIADAFLSLGADYVIAGGQTANPSTEDFLDAFRRVNADRIIVMPNNGNVIMTAETAARLYEDSEILVLKTRSIGEGYVALSMLNTDLETKEEVMENLEYAIDGVITAEVTHAVRDTEMSGLSIHAGDYIGIAGKTILASEKTRIDAARVMLASLDTEEKEVCIMIVGKDADRSDVDEMREYIRQILPDAELFEIDGGQEVYDFIFILE